MHTTQTDKGITFVHNGGPEDGPLYIVIDPTKIKTEFDTFNGSQFLTITMEYNTIRDFVLQKLARREIAKIEQMDGDELAAYFTGDWEKLDKLQHRN